MNNFISSSAFFGLWLTLAVFFLCRALNRKFKLKWLNPLLFSVVIIIVFLVCTKIDYETYDASSEYLVYLLTPSTVCFGILLYKQWELLKKNYKAILAGIFTGVITSLLCVLVFTVLFKFSHKEYVTFLPKSITTAIGMAISDEMGGYAAITSSVIIITGIFGNIMAESICKWFKIVDPVAVGIAIGSSSHALGTAKAIEIGEIQGAMSSLSIVISGIFTVILINVFAMFI